jgi:pseudaminic acid synthase
MNGLRCNTLNRSGFSRNICIAGRVIGTEYPPYVIAEISANHNGNLHTALQIIERAKMAGADAIKLQTYTADTITLDCDAAEFQIHSGLWQGQTLYQLYQDAHTPWDWHPALFEYARSLGITIFSSPFDNSAVDFLEGLNVPAYKIASFEAVDLPLIRYVASTGKPMIISTGMANHQEIEEAITTAREAGCLELAILHCVSGYPAPAEDYNLRTIPDMIERFGLATGLSDHTLGSATAIAGVALGACIVEKHLTLNRSDGGPDAAFSLEPAELATLCQGVATAWASLGGINYTRKSSEEQNTQFRRSLYFVKDLKAGEVIHKEAIRSVRPGLGLAPKHWDSVIGQKTRFSVKANTPVSWEAVEVNVAKRGD